MKNMKLRLKIILPTVILVFALLVAILVVTIVQFTSLSDSLVEERLEAVSNSVRHITDDTRQMVIDVGLRVSYDPRLPQAVLTANTQEILRVGNQLAIDYGVTYITVAGADTYVLARTDEPERYGDAFRTVALLEALDGIVSVAYTPVGQRLIPIRSSVPIFHEGEIIGVAVIGYALDTPKAVEALQERHNAEFTIFVHDEATGRYVRVSSTLTDEHGNSVVGTYMEDPYILDVVFRQRNELQTTITQFGEQFSAFYLPFYAPDGTELGVVFMALPLGEIIAQRTMVTVIAIIIGVVGLAVAVLIIFRIANGISKPIKIINEYMTMVSKDGDISCTPEEEQTILKNAARGDETGELFTAFHGVIKSLTEVSEDLKEVAAGNLTREITVRSDKDLLNIALNDMVNNLNRMFGDIQASTSQVSTGSKQIADGAQTLAQGSTEQAASVQQLSSSISEIAKKTKDNAQMAEKAASLANDIRSSAEKGSSQMDEMMMAVKDINESSQNIGKVIKSIDDIAFQTNILALNAAVEAARAGQHGKGFAVVAEEVRNLAAKSAEAAKDTESLIADSITKAELGSKIADETSASLSEIVSGIGESSRLVGDIARSSEEQTVGITQINTGIDQVANVVQQNSATAEQSAAASEEMSGQSDMLEQLISQFKLKNAQTFGSLPKPSTVKKLPSSAGYNDGSFGNSSDPFGKY
ncbi:MAG: methyl-accepting chemotaxis protein [Oscillospiraceae bacterium]|nr:methyl-accepting chemotaxis protein [Oscillospiraceae bacterium]MCL2279073.1 methyl-accepting chemotaxis protein [Oscillospiraceae bacterium]